MENLDKLIITNLRTRCIVGLREEERQKEQDVVLNITLYADLSRAGESDSIEDTVDYSSLKKEILTFVEGSSFLLIERLAQEIAGLCLKKKGVQGVRVRLDKPTALRFADSVGIEISRSRN